MSIDGPIVALGAGRMGRGIAHVFAYAGREVTLVDMKHRDPAASDALLAAARAEIAENLAFLRELGVLDGEQIAAVLARIGLARADQAAAALAAAEIVFEGVTETLDAKRDALGRAGALAGQDAIIASTTSTLPVDELATFVARPDRFLNAHWLNPAYLIPLVEVSPGANTDEAVFQAVYELLRSVGKVPVRCQPSPGYIVPRIQAVAMNEAARMIEEGVATPQDIDRAIQAGFGIRYATMGLVEFIDWGGVDILYYASRYLAEALRSDRFRPPDNVNALMQAGHTGLDAGRGFYDFGRIDATAFRRDKLAGFVAMLRHLDLLPPPA